MMELGFEKEIASATFALEFTPDLAIFFAIIGTYVGIIPVMIGLLWLPFIKKLVNRNIISFWH